MLELNDVSRTFGGPAGRLVLDRVVELDPVFARVTGAADQALHPGHRADSKADQRIALVKTDAGGGGFIGGAWEFGENMHVFGEFSSASQELEVRDGTGTFEGEFDVTRWRIGVGYAHPVSPTVDLYGRLSYDSAEFKDVSVAGFNLDADVDEGGVGGEIGMTWAATPAVQLQGHLRYTSVGEIAPNGSDTFDADVLVGVNGRWYFRPDFALVAGYEFGKITTVNVGVRYSF